MQEGPPSEIVTATSPFYASLQTLWQVGFSAMLEKQWLNRYLRHPGESTIERAKDTPTTVAGGGISSGGLVVLLFYSLPRDVKGSMWWELVKQWA